MKVVLDKLASFGVIVDLQRLKNAHEKYKVPRWYGQPNYVEEWLEKKAAAETIMSFLGDRQVRVVPVGGFDSWGDAYKHSQRLKMIREDSKKRGISLNIHILYIGDFDPSGDNIETHSRQQQNYFQAWVDLERIAVTKEQIEQYHLPPQPKDPQTLKKLGKDPRTGTFTAVHGQLYAVELEALTADACFIEANMTALY